jgi:hypothetical protein
LPVAEFWSVMAVKMLADVLAPVSSCMRAPQPVGCAWSYASTAAVQLLRLRHVLAGPWPPFIFASSSRLRDGGRRKKEMLLDVCLLIM